MKLFKDPIYGYIGIADDVVSDIIDSCYFQRLRNIRQTSYAALYHTSMHSRFMHSIGVYFLGQKAAAALDKATSSEYEADWWKNVKDVFSLACLLHDVGHAPFSHTGEVFFDKSTLHRRLIAVTSPINPDYAFQRDVQYNEEHGNMAAPHELMSAIIALGSLLGDHLTYLKNTWEKVFFARCITGYLYRTPENSKEELLNCLIQLLNSQIIDMDRLDYVIRDAFSSGYQSVSIDYERLINGITIGQVEGKKSIVYKKGALSIIENVIFAHDAERKWIQGHPVIVYDSNLVQQAIKLVTTPYPSISTLFCEQALTVAGTELPDGNRVCLLADEDILCMAKNLHSDNPFVLEYFCRDIRRHPVWKSEAEYQALFGEPSNPQRKQLAQNLLESAQTLTRYLGTSVFDKVALEKCKTIAESLQAIFAQFKNKALDEEQQNTLVQTYEKLFSKQNATAWLNCSNQEKLNLFKSKVTADLVRMECLQRILEALLDYHREKGFLFNFMLLEADMFSSNFAKIQANKIYIKYADQEPPKLIERILTLPQAAARKEKYFYFYYKRSQTNKIKMDANGFVEFMCTHSLPHIDGAGTVPNRHATQ